MDELMLITILIVATATIITLLYKLHVSTKEAVELLNDIKELRDQGFLARPNN